VKSYTNDDGWIRSERCKIFLEAEESEENRKLGYSSSLRLLSAHFCPREPRQNLSRRFLPLRDSLMIRWLLAISKLKPASRCTSRVATGGRFVKAWEQLDACFIEGVINPGLLEGGGGHVYARVVSWDLSGAQLAVKAETSSFRRGERSGPASAACCWMSGNAIPQDWWAKWS